MEILVVAFVLEDVANTFQLSSVQKGLIGSASFFGEPERFACSWDAGCEIDGLAKVEVRDAGITGGWTHGSEMST